MSPLLAVSDDCGNTLRATLPLTDKFHIQTAKIVFDMNANMENVSTTET